MNPGQLYGIRRWLWLALIAALACAAAMYVHERRKHSSYSATAVLQFDAVSPVAQLLGVQSAGSSGNPTGTGATNVALAALPEITARTIRSLHLSGTAYPDVKVAASGQSNLVNVTATQATAALALRIANAYAQQVVAYTLETQRANVNSGLGSLKRSLASLRASEPRSPAIPQLQTSIGELEAVAAVEPVDVSVAQFATSASQTSTHVAEYALLAFLAGGVGMLSLLVLLASADPRIHALESLSLAPGVVTITRRPSLLRLRSGRWRRTDEPDADSYMLGAILSGAYARRGPKDSVVILVLGAGGRAEVPTTSDLVLRLASTSAAGRGSRSVLVSLGSDATDTAQRVSVTDAGEHNDAEPSATPAAEVIRWVAIKGNTPAQPFAVLATDSLPSNMVDTSRAVQALFSELRDTYSVVIAYCPSISDLGSAAFLLDDSDAVAVAVAMHRSVLLGTQNLVSMVSNRRKFGLFVVVA